MWERNTQFLMWERRSHAFPPHYTTVCFMNYIKFLYFLVLPEKTMTSGIQAPPTTAMNVEIGSEHQRLGSEVDSQSTYTNLVVRYEKYYYYYI